MERTSFPSAAARRLSRWVRVYCPWATVTGRWHPQVLDASVYVSLSGGAVDRAPQPPRGASSATSVESVSIQNIWENVFKSCLCVAAFRNCGARVCVRLRVCVSSSVRSLMRLSIRVRVSVCRGYFATI